MSFLHWLTSEPPSKKKRNNLKLSSKRQWEKGNSTTIIRFMFVYRGDSFCSYRGIEKRKKKSWIFICFFDPFQKVTISFCVCVFFMTWEERIRMVLSCRVVRVFWTPNIKKTNISNILDKFFNKILSKILDDP